MSQPCAIKSCKRASRTLCHCCNQNLCRDHFNQHDDLLNSQLNPLADQLNTLGDRLTAINIDKITGDSREKLDQWRIDCHKTIDCFYEQKCEELNRYFSEGIDKHRKEIANLCFKMNELIDKQETTKNDINLLTSDIRSLEQKINEIEKTHVQVSLRRLVIDDHCIQIRQLNLCQFDLSSLPSPYQTINRLVASNRSLASNDRFLLTHIDSNLCLIDENLLIIKYKKWNDIRIEDMCWSSTLNCFFVITKKDIFLVNENTMSIDQVHTIGKENWWSCACSDKSLYLSHGIHDSSLFEFSLLPSIKFVKVWKTTDGSKQKQRFDSIVYNDGTFGLGVNDKHMQAKFIDLRSSKTFDLLWSFQLDISYNMNMIRCCLVNKNEWLVVDWYTTRIFHVTSEGKINKTDTYQSVPYDMQLFSSNILIVLTKERIHFHKL